MLKIQDIGNDMAKRPYFYVTKRLNKKGVRYRRPMATSGVMSNLPILGTTLLNGANSGLVISISTITSRLLGLITNQVRIARRNTAKAKIRQK